MRILVVLALVVGLGACKSKPRAEPEPEPSKNPYHNVMPDKLKKQVEDTQKKEDEKSDKVLENAK